MQLLDRLHPSDRELLLSLQDLRGLSAGETLFEQGDPADCAVLIHEGELALELYAPGGDRPVETYVASSGDLIGEPALVAKSRRGRRAIARTDAKLGLVHRADLRSLLSSFHAGSMRIVLEVARRIADRVHRSCDERHPDAALQSGASVRPSALDPRPYLPIFPFFRAFTTREIDELLQLGKLWDLDRGVRILRHGQTSQRCFLVVRGAVGIEQSGLSIGIIGPGQTVGEMAPLTGRPATADLVMREHGTLLELGPGALSTLTAPENRVAFKFTNAIATALAERLARTNRQVARDAMGLCSPPGAAPWPT